MRQQFYAGVIFFLALLPAQITGCYGEFISFLIEVDLAIEGERQNNLLIQASGAIGDKEAEDKAVKALVDEAVKEKSITKIDALADVRKNDGRVRLLKTAMLIAADEDTRANLTMASAIRIYTDAAGKPHTDPVVQNDVRIQFSNSLLTVMDTYDTRTPQWGRLRTAYCANLGELQKRPSAGDLLAITDSPTQICN